MTPLSRIALRTTAPSPICTPSISTESDTSAPSLTHTAGESTDWLTVPPVTTTPGERIELKVDTPAPLAPSTSLAGGCGP